MAYSLMMKDKKSKRERQFKAVSWVYDTVRNKEP